MRTNKRKNVTIQGPPAPRATKPPDDPPKAQTTQPRYRTNAAIPSGHTVDLPKPANDHLQPMKRRDADSTGWYPRGSRA